MNKKRRILFFAHYYYPDTASTGQIIQDQAEEMQREFDVTVVCTVPSYTGKVDEKYKDKKFYFEIINGVNIIRVKVPEFAKENKLSRINNILAYFFRAIGACIKAGKQDYIFTISQPPVLGGILGVIGKSIKHAKLIYCIQDFNPEQIMAVNYSKNRLIINAMMFIDKFSCKRSDLVITVGRDLVDTLKKRFSGKKVPKYTMINNWIDEKNIYPIDSNNKCVQNFKKKYNLEDKFVIMYSGNIGLYYDLENILKVIERLGSEIKTPDGKKVVFAFVGAGSVLKNLTEYANEHNMTNVIFIPYQKKEELIYSLNAADVHWCVNAKGIKGVSCPSKFYGIAAVAKPILGVLEKGSEIERLISETNCGLVCAPESYDEIEKNILWFIKHSNDTQLTAMGKRGFEYLQNNLTKNISIQKYIDAINNL